MQLKNIHPARRVFRKALLGLMGLSFVFLLFIIGLRVTYRDGHIDGAMQTAVFEADVLQHKARALVGNDAQDMVIIRELFGLAFFSPIYYHAGYAMLEDKADDGYAPAVVQLAAIDNRAASASP